MAQKILSDKVMNERTNAYYSCYPGERNISVLPLNAYDPPGRFIAYIKKNKENLNITFSDFEFEQIISGMRLKVLAFLVPLEKIFWIANSKRACLFSWYLLMQFIQNNRVKISVDLFQKNKLCLKEKYLEGNVFPSDSSTQSRQILRVLDILSDKNLWNEWIIQTEDRWMRTFKSKSPFSCLLPEDEHECTRTWDYLKGKSIALEKLAGSPGSADIYHVIHLSFDIWVTCPLTPLNDIENFRNSFNEAKAQRKYKKMREDRVNVQFFLDAETRAQLKESSRVRRLSTGEMLHDLIVEEYKRYRHSR